MKNVRHVAALPPKKIAKPVARVLGVLVPLGIFLTAELLLFVTRMTAISVWKRKLAKQIVAFGAVGNAHRVSPSPTKHLVKLMDALGPLIRTIVSACSTHLNAIHTTAISVPVRLPATPL